MQISARNQLSGIVKSISNGVVNSEVVVALPNGSEIVASITCESVKNLELVEGKPVVALVKAGTVLIAADLNNIKLSARNQLTGTISHIERGAVHSLVELDLGNGLGLSASITVKSAEELNLCAGQKATAVFKAGAVILGVAA
ncbi:molybdopterin-binding protein [Neisseria sp. 83E34]|uniref:TOBE domain-containing protein n=1 Tax=Neisseria sp. 83E34 TaxID=1692264 RepID=UPI0006CE6B3F|nr:TOBE domain-containing protein [Neisseria sp. 83E34]KPN72166.1 transporter [Neisseria sp. 83E34]